MDVGAAEVTVLAVEKKAAVGGELEPAEAEGRHEVVGGAFAVEHGGLDRVERGLLGRPEAGLRDGLAGLVEGFGGARREVAAGAHRGDDAALGVEDLGAHGAGLGVGGAVDDLGLHVDDARGGGDARGGDEGAIPGDVQGIGGDEPDVAVDAAAEVVLAGARGEAGIPAVVEAHGDEVLAGDGGVGDVDFEAGVAALVSADGAAVDPDLGVLESAVEVEEEALAAPRGGHVEAFPIPAVADVEGVGRGEIRHAEAVRQADGGPGRVVEGRGLRAGVIAEEKFPVAVEVEPFAERGRIRRGGGGARCGDRENAQNHGEGGAGATEDRCGGAHDGGPSRAE